jgi:hypothetical protein
MKKNSLITGRRKIDFASIFVVFSRLISIIHSPSFFRVDPTLKEIIGDIAFDEGENIAFRTPARRICCF